MAAVRNLKMERMRTPEDGHAETGFLVKKGPCERQVTQVSPDLAKMHKAAEGRNAANCDIWRLWMPNPTIVGLPHQFFIGSIAAILWYRCFRFGITLYRLCRVPAASYVLEHEWVLFFIPDILYIQVDALTCLPTGSETHKPVDPVCGESIDLHLLAEDPDVGSTSTATRICETKAVPDKRTLRRWQDGNFRKASALPAELVDADYLSAIPITAESTYPA
ncbi:hypothetical protein B0H10DRAFT_1957943 [Mycena sp. CBHHK59/15]|nr:hypothetical protein B0H10DRAFT_1957943 [Mycena sp. CBHHK59/15]